MSFNSKQTSLCPLATTELCLKGKQQENDESTFWSDACGSQFIQPCGLRTLIS